MAGLLRPSRVKIKCLLRIDVGIDRRSFFSQTFYLVPRTERTICLGLSLVMWTAGAPCLRQMIHEMISLKLERML
jgi:hypothetical protein